MKNASKIQWILFGAIVGFVGGVDNNESFGQALIYISICAVLMFMLQMIKKFCPHSAKCKRAEKNKKSRKYYKVDFTKCQGVEI